MTKIAACQLKEIRRNIPAVAAVICEYAAKADEQDVQLLCFPECYLQGYLLDEPIARHHALDLNSSAFSEVLECLPLNGPMLVIGLIETQNDRLYNSAIVVKNRQFLGVYRKTYLLPGESIYTAGTSFPVFKLDKFSFGINICYDTNFPEASLALKAQGAQLIVCPANNLMDPVKSEKYKHIHNAVRAKRCQENGLWLISSDVTGELNGRISYGPTAVIDPTGSVVAQTPLQQEGLVVTEMIGGC